VRWWPFLFALAGCGRLGFAELDDRDSGATGDGGPGDGSAGDAIDAPDQPAACATNPQYLLGDNGVRYHQLALFRTWDQAQEICAAEGAHLPIIDDAMEAQESLINDWVGITDVLVEGEWRTVKGDLATFLPWAAGEPGGGTTDNCGRIDNSGVLEARECIDLRDFSCECPD
jgi:hypothetical protein